MGVRVDGHAYRLARTWRLPSVRSKHPVVGGSRLFVERSSFVDQPYSYGIMVDGGAYANIVSSTFGRNNYHLYVKSSHADVSGSTFQETFFAGISIASNGGDGASLRLENSVLSSNSGLAKNCIAAASASFTTRYNIYDDASCISDVFVDNSLHNTEPLFSGLGDWGGVTPTHMPLPGSPAIDHAPASLCQDAGIDQRGEVRPVAYSGNVEPRCDAGAVELAAMTDPEQPWTAPVFDDGFEHMD